MAGLDVPTLLLLSPLSTDQGQTPIANRQLISATRQTENPKVSRGLVSSPVTADHYATISLREDGGLRLETRDPVSQAQASQPSHYRTFLRMLDLLIRPHVGEYEAVHPKLFGEDDNGNTSMLSSESKFQLNIFCKAYSKLRISVL